MKPRTEEYEAKARECDEQAKQIVDPHSKDEMLQMAQRWRDLAAAAEKSRW